MFRVRKADAEAALAGKLDDQGFKARVEIRVP